MYYLKLMVKKDEYDPEEFVERLAFRARSDLLNIINNKFNICSNYFALVLRKLKHGLIY